MHLYHLYIQVHKLCGLLWLLLVVMVPLTNGHNSARVVINSNPRPPLPLFFAGRVGVVLRSEGCAVLGERVRLHLLAAGVYWNAASACGHRPNATRRLSQVDVPGSGSRICTSW